MREFINIVESFVQPAFGRKGVAPTRHIEPAPPKFQDEVNRAKQHDSAEDYAEIYNPIHPSHPNHARERERLMNRWNTFRHHNWL